MEKSKTRTTENGGKLASNEVEELRQQYSHSVSSGLETGGTAVVVFGNKGERQVMALQGTKLRLIQSSMRLKLSCWRPRFKS